MVAENQIGHGLHDRDGSRQDTGIVTTAAFQFGVFHVT